MDNWCTTNRILQKYNKTGLIRKIIDKLDQNPHRALVEACKYGEEDIIYILLEHPSVIPSAMHIEIICVCRRDSKHNHQYSSNIIKAFLEYQSLVLNIDTVKIAIKNGCFPGPRLGCHGYNNCNGCHKIIDILLKDPRSNLFYEEVIMWSIQNKYKFMRKYYNEILMNDTNIVKFISAIDVPSDVIYTILMFYKKWNISREKIFILLGFCPKPRPPKKIFLIVSKDFIRKINKILKDFQKEYKISQNLS